MLKCLVAWLTASKRLALLLSVLAETAFIDLVSHCILGVAELQAGAPTCMQYRELMVREGSVQQGVQSTRALFTASPTSSVRRASEVCSKGENVLCCSSVQYIDDSNLLHARVLPTVIAVFAVRLGLF